MNTAIFSVPTSAPRRSVQTFFIEYAGMPVRLPAMVVCREVEASRFNSVEQATAAIIDTNLPPHQFRIVQEVVG